MTDDLISRQKVLDVINLNWEYRRNCIRAIEKLPPVNPQPCEDANANQHNSNALNTLEGDAISRQVLDEIKELMTDINGDTVYAVRMSDIRQLPSVTQKSWKCKNCKYFEYDSVAKVDGIPLIVAHEICSRWSNGCKTREDGYCFLFEPQESEVQHDTISVR